MQENENPTKLHPEAKKIRLSRRTGTYKNCKKCNNEFYARKSESGKRYCSAKCGNESRRKYIREIRSCRYCDKQFEAHERPFSNTSSNYCSRDCYSQSLVGHYRGLKIDETKRAYRKQWKKIRSQFIKKNDFCCQCGKRDGRLHVHHIDPHATSRNNEEWNLVTLCSKCHSMHDKKISSLIKARDEKIRKEMVFYVKAHMHDLWHLHQGRRLLCK